MGMKKQATMQTVNKAQKLLRDNSPIRYKLISRPVLSINAVMTCLKVVPAVRTSPTASTPRALFGLKGHALNFGSGAVGARAGRQLVTRLRGEERTGELQSQEVCVSLSFSAFCFVCSFHSLAYRSRRTRPCCIYLLVVPEIWGIHLPESTHTSRDGCPQIRRKSDYQEPRSSAAHMGNFKARK